MSTSTNRLGIAWLSLAAPVGTLVFLLSRLSDHEHERRIGDLLIVLAALSVVLGVTLLQRARPGLRGVSLALSGLWLAAAVVVVVVLEFLADQLWGAGLTALVAVVTGVLALTGRESR